MIYNLYRTVRMPETAPSPQAAAAPLPAAA